MLNYAYTFRINLIEQLLTKVRNFFTSYVSIFKKKLTNNKISNEEILEIVINAVNIENHFI